MKKNEFAEIKKMDIKALKIRAKKNQKEITDLTVDKNMNKMPNLKLIKTRRNELAKTLTVLKQKSELEKLEKETVVEKEKNEKNK